MVNACTEEGQTVGNEADRRTSSGVLSLTVVAAVVALTLVVIHFVIVVKLCESVFPGISSEPICLVPYGLDIDISMTPPLSLHSRSFRLLVFRRVPIFWIVAFSGALTLM